MRNITSWFGVACGAFLLACGSGGGDELASFVPAGVAGGGGSGSDRGGVTAGTNAGIGAGAAGTAAFAGAAGAGVAGTAGANAGAGGSGGTGSGGTGSGGTGSGAASGGGGAAGSGSACTDGSCIAELALGGYHTCARLGNGTLRCWGSNMAGQIGVVTMAPQVLSAREPVPVVVPGVVASAITLGDWHTCALTQSGEVLCWGSDALGALGIGLECSGGEPCGTSTPTKVDLGAKAVAVAAGGGHTCALLASGSVSCWGQNFKGQLGPVGVGSSKLPPNVVPGVAGAVKLAAGGDRSCAIVASGEVVCWGYQGGAPCSNGGSAKPLVVTKNQGAVALSVGANHGCVLGQAGAVSCWGDNTVGELGVVSAPPSCGKGASWEAAAKLIATPLASYLSVGGGHICDGSGGGVRCWGSNSDGQLGVGNTQPSATPQLVGGAGKLTAFAAGRAHSCAVWDGKLSCWGSNWYGQVGDGHAYAESAPLSPVLVVWDP